jgi:serine protease Do
LIKEGKVVRGYLGVDLLPQGLNATLARNLGLPNSRGAVVMLVHPGGPAERAGIKPGDVIVNVAKHDVADRAALRNLTAGLDVGAQVPVTVYREGKPQTVTVTIEELPPAPEVLTRLGFNVRPSPTSSDTSGASVEIDRVIPGSPAFQAGLRPGMRIVAVGQEPVGTVAQFEAAVRKLDPRGGLPLVVQSHDGRVGPVLVGGSRENRQP